MVYVHLLSEDDFDDQVYLYLLEMLLARPVKLAKNKTTRLRKGGGIGEVRKKLPILCEQLRRSAPVDGMFFLVAIDNDRAREHPTHEKRAHHTDQRDDCRDCALSAQLAAAMPDGRPIPGVIAVPVQMIESWLLMMADPRRFPKESQLPVCARQHQAIARSIYGSKPPPQLKDLVEELAGERSQGEFALECILRLDADDLAGRAPSFARFREQVASLSLPPRE